MVSQMRARSEEAKEARRAEILGQTLELWAQARYEDLTLQAVAQRVGLTKAALYGYFPTKESLFLSLYETLLSDFLDELQRHLRLGGRHTPRSLAALVAALLAEHAPLTRLMPHLAGLLERNISETRAREHKHWLLGRLGPLSASLEAALPGLPAGGGVALLTYTQALVAGLYPMSDPAPAVGAALQDPVLSPLCVQLDVALPAALQALYRGLSASPDEQGT
ncbi:TetR/AcrR family transcriptional regulator [Deinococcus hohokamensis]|uniref:TetR/AcrR family transcriptional regulator n=1 Tax=Deinococcus hohokamensis TaxID=309883 RepID=A0ABV9I7F9_9DEIO